MKALRSFLLSLAIGLIALPSYSQIISHGGEIIPREGLLFQDEGVNVGKAKIVNIVGAGASVARSGNTATITVTGGGSSSSGGGEWGTITGTLSDQTDLQAALDLKVDENASITGATKTKITYDAKGLVTGGADATTADIADSSNKRYVTDANLVVINNTSGTNTGNQSSIVGITGTKAEFNTAVTDGNFLYVGDITQYTDELAQDAVGGIVGDTSTVNCDYDDGAPSITCIVIDGSITNAKLATVATATFKGRTTAGTGAPEDLTISQAKALLDLAGSNTGDQTTITGNAGTASSLAANGTNCTAGNYPLGVDAAGNVETCTAAATGTVTSVSGTANRVTSTGGATPVIDISGTFEALLGKVATGLGQFASTTSATLAGVISDETGTNKLVYSDSPTLVTPALGTPASGNLANCTFPTLNQNTTGTANIAGGTAGAIPYQSGANATTVLAATATANKILLSGASAAPVWSTPTFPNASATSLKYIRSDGTNWIASTSTFPDSYAQGDILYSSATNVISALAKNASATRYLSNTGTTNNPAWAQVDVTNGITGAVPVANGGTNATTTASARTNLGLDKSGFSFIINGNGSTITTGNKNGFQVPYACTIASVTVLGDQSGSVVIDVWKDTYGNYPPTVADTITASAKPTISSTTKATDSTLTGWTKAVAEGDILFFNVDSVTSFTKLAINFSCLR